MLRGIEIPRGVENLVRAQGGVQRQGFCTEGCGACCRFLILQVNPQYNEVAEVKKWIELHGIKLRVDEQGACWASIPLQCTELTAEGMCGLFGKAERPKTCDVWPTSQATIDELDEYVGEKVCTYEFREK